MNFSPNLLLDNFFIFPKCEVYISLESNSFSEENQILKKIILTSLQKYDGFLIISYGKNNNTISEEQKKTDYKVFMLVQIISPVKAKDCSELELSDLILNKIKRIKFCGVSRAIITSKKNIKEKIIIEKNEETQEEKYKTFSLNIVEYEKIPEEVDKKKILILTEKIASSITVILEKSQIIFPSIDYLNKTGPIEVIDFISQNGKQIDKSLKLKLLNELDPSERLEILLNIPNKKKIEVEIDEITKKNIQKDQEAYYLLKRKEAIERRLRESRGYGSEEIRKILERLDKEPFPQHIKKLIYQKIEQFETSSNVSGENNMIQNYINWVMNIPWWRQTEEVNDLILAKKKLDEKHFGLTEVKERVIEYLAARGRAGKSMGQVICLLGPPGVGKTSLAESIAEATGRNFISISLGGVSDEAEIRGNRSSYIGSYPGKIVKALVKAKSINPLILLDEIDKIGHSWRGDPAFALLEVLDSSSNNKFVDNYLGEESPCDLSKVFFICTANYFYDIPSVLADRLDIINLSSYTEKEKVEIAKNYLIPNGIKKYNLSEIKINFKDEAIEEIIDYYTREAGVRNLRNKLDTILRKFIVQLVNKTKESLIVDVNEIHNYLKKRIFDYTRIKKPRPGVFNGLVYTSYGSGDILPIEVAYYEKKGGDNEFTGNLGDVMKESCLIALTYIRSNCKKFGIKSDFFSKNCIHINALGGATPKDGPSGGVALTTAIISAATNKTVPEYFGATGEISINGWIEPIGGLKEKLIGAQRSKLKTVFIPKDNKKDLEDVSDDIKNNLNIVAVENYEEIWNFIFKDL